MGSETPEPTLLEHPSEFVQGLLEAVLDDDETIVRQNIEWGYPLDWDFPQYGTVLQVAACRGQESMVKLLLELGANTETQCGPYGNALQAAAAWGHESIVQLLLKRDADPELEGGMHNTALEAAIQNDKSDVAELLIGWKQGVKTRTILRIAAERGNTRVAKLLIPHHTKYQISQAISAALTRKRTLTARRLVEGIKNLGEHGKDILNAAVTAQDLELIRYLFDEGVYTDGESLNRAIMTSNKEVLTLLFEKCEDLPSTGRRAASTALKMGYKDLARMLFDVGAYVDDDLLMNWECDEETLTLMLDYADKSQKKMFFTQHPQGKYYQGKYCRKGRKTRGR